MSPRWRVEAGTRLLPVIRIALLAVIVLGAAGTLWAAFGLYRDSLGRVSATAARNGLLLEAGSREDGWFSSTWRGVKLSLRGVPGITVEIDRLHFRHWPFAAPRMTVAHAQVRLRGEPAPLLAEIRHALRVELGEVAVENLAVTYEHRVLGRIVLDGARVRDLGSSVLVEAKRARAGGFDWPDVRLAVGPRKEMFVIGWGADVASAPLQLSCFPSAGGQTRWHLDVLHQPARPLLARLGWDLGKESDGTQVAGGISLDVPDDPAAPPHGRVQLVFDGWPLGAPAGSQALLGGTLSILSSFVPAIDGSRWELPRVEITMPVFSLVGKGHLELGRQPSLAIAADGERSCRELRALLPPSPERGMVERFLGTSSAPLHRSAAAPLPAQLALRVRAGAGAHYRAQWDFRPACGLTPWEEQQQ